MSARCCSACHVVLVSASESQVMLVSARLYHIMLEGTSECQLVPGDIVSVRWR